MPENRALYGCIAEKTAFSYFQIMQTGKNRARRHFTSAKFSSADVFRPLLREKRSKIILQI